MDYRTSLTQGDTTARLTLSCDSARANELIHGGEGRMYAVVARISGVQPYEEVTTQSAAGEASAERRFTASGTELAQEDVGKSETNSFRELLRSLGCPPTGSER
jgi:hypothetical protein